MATALYRRYRPETFSEMIGQAHVTEPLMTALRTERIGHAYLFSGPRGCGKTTSARILARCLNCAEGPTDTPCGTCPSCVELSRDGGGSLDVVEIDAASHGGVDDARELRERAVFAPARDRYKVFIIDEAHMVTSGGFNALLKIVEEPPPHVKFIFATTEPDKVIGTIRSRTHHYPFRLIAPGTLIDYVQQLCDSEGIEVEPGVLPLVVRAGGGSVRDTLSILDQLIAGSEGKRVDLERATGLLGFTSAELIDEVVAAFAAADSAAAFGATDRVVQTGQDPRRFVEDLLERLRDLIVISATTVQGASAVFRGVPDDQLQRMFEQAQRFSPEYLSRIADTVSGALDRMTGATAPRLHLELMVARALVVQSAGSAEVQAGPRSSVARSASNSQPAAPASQPAPAPQPAQTPRPAAAAPAPVPSSSTAAASTEGPEVDVIATLRSARDFLNSDSAGARGAAPVTALPVPETADAPAIPSAPSVDAPSDAAPSGVSPEPVTLSELREVWPELLQEILDADRDAWNAVKNVQPLTLQGEVLRVGTSSQSDLDVFKEKGAGPLREAIEAALGVRVKYLAKLVQAQPAASQGSSREAESAPAEPSPTAEAPTPALSVAPSVAEPTVAAQPEVSEPPAPAWADFDARQDDDPDFGGGGREVEDPPSEAPVSEPATSPEPTPAPEPMAMTPGIVKPNLPEPIEGRYGEAVVREVLGAKFIEERPLPHQEA